MLSEGLRRSCTTMFKNLFWPNIFFYNLSMSNLSCFEIRLVDRLMTSMSLSSRFSFITCIDFTVLKLSFCTGCFLKIGFVAFL